ncbi:tRNA pseudouridine synthase A [Ceratina calcarata]|uniref:Pseudouridylate synthase 1 homolog n=1 Tax=Ceratina calcarata TaxID=156304 RepID=A0AAJ7JEB8_9HYME|nr:tRNA pseudouridine synthase A [Ceratina calcarata]
MKYRANLRVFQFLRLQHSNIFCKSMSTQVDSVSQDENIIEQTNKRQIGDEEINGVPAKTAKIEGNEKKFKRKNSVIMLSYVGRDYLGMQINRGTKTIEECLLSALLKADFITKEQFEDVREIKFQRAARTDKGVSAVRNIVSLKLPDHVNKEDINKHLPEDIRVFGIKRVTKGFNSKNRCDARTYRYVLPTFAFAPEDPNFLRIEKEEEEIDEEKRLKQLSVIDGKPYNEFRLTPEMLEKLSETLKLLEGTHNFHNFTSRTKPMDPRAKRYIVYFRCVETFVANDMEFAVLEIKGQSFMLHQIRKMVSLVVGICRNIVTSDIVKDAFSLERVDIPIAPGLGLSLHFVHYGYYNERYGEDGIHETLDWKECDEDVERFYKDHILKDIVDTEIAKNVTLKWLASFLTPKRFAFKDVVPVTSTDAP